MLARPFTPLHKGRGKPRGRGAGEGLLLGGRGTEATVLLGLFVFKYH